MNDDFLECNWEQLKGKIKQEWGKLTDQDLDLINGQEDMLVGNLQAEYGWSKEEAQRRVGKFKEMEPAYLTR